MIEFVKGGEREIADLPEAVTGNLADALARLDAGLSLSMPLSGPMPDVGIGVHELRLRERSGVFRVFYCVRSQGAIFLLHAMQKKTRGTTPQTLKLVRKRLQEVL